jgi:hypothetical protein
MKALQISDKLARKIYPSADNELKDLLEENFGKPFFSEKITDRVKNFEDACEIMGVDPNSNGFTCIGTPDDRAYKCLKVIVGALNEGWTPDWNNTNEPKYYPWFELKGGFRLDDVICNYDHSVVGSRLCFKSRELAQYAATQFEDLYKQFFTL